MTDPNASTDPAWLDIPPQRDEQRWADQRFDPGPPPSNEVVVDPELPDAPDVSHP